METTMASILIQQQSISPLKEKQINQQRERVIESPVTPLKKLKAVSLTPGKSHVNALLGERAIVGNIQKSPLGRGSEKTVYDVNFGACGRRYALNVAHPNRTVKNDLDGLYFGVKGVSADSTLGLSRIAVGDLMHLMKQNPTLPVSKQLNQIILPFLQTIKSIHDQGLVHCDIKLENALYKLDENGNYMVEPSDLGMAQPIGNTRRFCGTYDNIPPELYDFYGKYQHNKNNPNLTVRLPKIKVNSQQDVWGLGSMIALILTRKHLGTVLNEVYGHKKFQQNLSDIRNHPETKDLQEGHQKRLAQTVTNLSYNSTYKRPDYNTQDVIAVYCSMTTDPLARQILLAIKNCFAINPADRPTVDELITELSFIAGLTTGATQVAFGTAWPVSEPTIDPPPKRSASGLPLDCLTDPYSSPSPAKNRRF